MGTEKAGDLRQDTKSCDSPGFMEGLRTLKWQIPVKRKQLKP